MSARLDSPAVAGAAAVLLGTSVPEPEGGVVGAAEDVTGTPVQHE